MQTSPLTQVFQLDFYRVSEGKASPIFPCYGNEDWITADSVVVYARNERYALKLAELYDEGFIAPDNMICPYCGNLHIAIIDEAITNFMERIGKNIRIYRKRENLTQTELAKRIDSTQRMISDYETGTAEMSMKRFFKIAEVLNCEPEDLL